MTAWLCAFLAALLIPSSSAELPKSFKYGEQIPVKVGMLTSTQVPIPKEFHPLPLAGRCFDEIWRSNPTGYQLHTRIRMGTDQFCTTLCQLKLTPAQAARLRVSIEYGYHNNWIIDNLPSAVIELGTHGEEKKRYAGGFPIGFINPDDQLPYMYNHVNIHIQFHPAEDGNRVVGFAIEPLSVKPVLRQSDSWLGSEFVPESCPPDKKHMTRNDIRISQPVKEGEVIIFTCDVIWEESDIEWSSRWDVYLSEGHHVPSQALWYSITNSILMVLFLSLLVVLILVRSLRRDIDSDDALSALLDGEKDVQVDKTGWKLVHADVFRPPQSMPMLFCVFLGSGAQICLAALIAILFSAKGGSFTEAMWAFYTLLGIVAGNVSGRLYKAFQGRQWQHCTIITALFFPGIVFGTFLIFNLNFGILISHEDVPFLDVVVLTTMWCCVSIPLVFLGSYFGYVGETTEFPTVTNAIAREIPAPPPLLHPMVGMAMAGIIPLAAAYMELFFIMTSLWMNAFYYVFGFTLIAYLILIVTCSEVTVLLVYYQLCAENHRWWWYSFFCSGSTAFYIFLYSLFWFNTLEASGMLMTYVLYFGYMFLISFAMFLVCGTVGALSSLWFVRKIFSTIKVD